MLNIQWQCDRCGKWSARSKSAGPSGILPVEGWYRIDSHDYCPACVVSYRHWAERITRHECWTDDDGKLGCVAECSQCGEQKRVYNSKHDPDTGEHFDMVCESCVGGLHCGKCGTPVPQWVGHNIACIYSKQNLCDTCHRQVARNGERAN